MVDITLITILSKEENINTVIHNSKYFNKTIIFVNMEHIPFSIQQLHNITVIKLNYIRNVSNYSKLRNQCLCYLEEELFYLFLDDDEEIKSINLDGNLNNNYYRIWINNYPSVGRLFKYNKQLRYLNNVHEELNVEIKAITSIHINHKGTRSKDKVLKYINLTDNVYYKIRDYFSLRMGYILSSDDINEILLTKDLSSIVLLLILKLYFDMDLIHDRKIQNQLNNILIKQNERLKDPLIVDLINNKLSSFETISNQFWFQEKQLLQLQLFNLGGTYE